MAEENALTSLASIIADIKDTNSEIYWPDEEGWRQFIKDHYELIKAKATFLVIAPNDMRKQVYSVGTLLAEKGYPVSIGWIVLWLNQLESVLHLADDTITLMIPNLNQLQQLKQQYITNRTLLKKNCGSTDL